MRSKRESKYLMIQRLTLKHLRKKTPIPIWFSGLYTHQSKGRYNKYLQQKQTFSRWNLNFKIWPQKKKKKASTCSFSYQNYFSFIPRWQESDIHLDSKRTAGRTRQRTKQADTFPWIQNRVIPASHLHPTIALSNSLIFSLL